MGRAGLWITENYPLIKPKENERIKSVTYGDVPEWLNGPDSKSGIGATLSEVRILPSPPIKVIMNSTPYSRIAQIADTYDIYLRVIGYERSVRKFVDHLPFGPEMPIKVLDAGCGTGLYSLAILKKYPNAQITAFDEDAKLVQHFTEKLERKGLENKVRTFPADICGTLSELGQEKFDLIITAGVLEYVSIENTVQNLARYMKPEGYFMNSPVSNKPLGLVIGWLYGCKPYSQQTNLQAFTNNGFSLIELFVPRTLTSFKELHIFRKLIPLIKNT